MIQIISFIIGGIFGTILYQWRKGCKKQGYWIEYNDKGGQRIVE